MSDLVRELANGLARADTDLAIPADAVAMLVNNVAGVPAPDVPGADSRGLPGFDAILFDSDGTPTHFCRCRPAGDPAVAHEVAVARAVSADPSLASHLPRNALAATSRLSACVSPYEAGLCYATFIARQPTAEWATAVEEIAGISERMAPLVAQSLPDLVPSRPVAFAEEAGSALDRLAALELSPKRRDALLRALIAGGTVPSVLQHGDLRPSNVLHRAGGWLLLGLDGFGRIRTPLYDLFHLLHTSYVGRGGQGEGVRALWIDALRDPGDDSTAARAILRRAVRRHELSPHAALGSLAHYLVDQAAGGHTSASGDASGSGHVAEAGRLAELLRQGAGPVAFGLAAA